MTHLPVLNDGFVTYIDHMGDDLRVANVARVSMGKWKQEFDLSDAKLLAYLWEHEHTSPFRHCFLSMRVRAPIFVIRQWAKHQVGCAWNEVSGRYVEMDTSFYLPDEWRLQSTSIKQGSGEEVLNRKEQVKVDILLDEAYALAEQTYNALLAAGICKEQARIVLPAGLYTEFVWTASLHAVLHFLHLRLDSHAQWEIRQYALAVKQLVQEHFPETYKVVFP